MRAVPPGNEPDAFSSAYSVAVIAGDGTCAFRARTKNGAGLSSTSGSTVITICDLPRPSGKVRPEGALTRKSSPGNGGAGAKAAEKGAAASGPFGAENLPVVNGMPFT